MADYDLPLADCAGDDQSGFICDPFFNSFQSAYFQGRVDLHAMWKANNHNGSTIQVGNNEVKITIALTKL